MQYTKGAPDEILRRCTTCWEGGKALPMTEEKRAAILADNKGLADRALRVLAASFRRWDQSARAGNSPEFLEQDLCFIGLTGMIDPVRPEVKDAIVECRSAGIRPVMITGDHKDTAVAIATELGIIHSADEAITGADLNEMSDEELDKQHHELRRLRPRPARAQGPHRHRLEEGRLRHRHDRRRRQRRALHQERPTSAWAWASPAPT